MKIRFLLPGLCLGLAVALLSGCATDEPKKKKSLARKPGKYTPLREYALELIPTSRRDFVAGTEAEITFSLRNNGNTKIRLEDWHVHQPDNIRMWVQNWAPDMKEPDPGAWLELNEDPDPADMRYPADMMPGNALRVSKALSFVRFLQVSPNAERRYFVRAELTLETVKVASDAFGIAVRGPKQK